MSTNTEPTNERILGRAEIALLPRDLAELVQHIAQRRMLAAQRSFSELQRLQL